jgi:hypothetical protein
VEHEFGHQYWYGMVATNEFEDAWLDEGVNSYTEVKILDDVLGRDTSFLNQFGITAGEHEVQHLQFIGVADLDPMARKAYEYASFNSYGGITYGKTANILLTLEKQLAKTPCKGPARISCAIGSRIRPGGFPQDVRRGLVQGLALVFQPSRLRHSGLRLRSDAGQFRSRELVRKKSPREEG